MNASLKLRERVEKEIIKQRGLKPRPLDAEGYIVIPAADRKYWVVCGYHCAARVPMRSARSRSAAIKYALRSTGLWRFDGIDAAVDKAWNKALQNLKGKKS